MPLTRRHLLARAVPGASAALVLAGCGLLGRRDKAPVPSPSASPSTGRPGPVVALLAAEEVLLAEYDAVLVRHPGLLPRLAAVRADHAAHLAALARLVGTSPGLPPAVAADTPSAALAQLRGAERTAAARAGAACLQAPAAHAALLGSIAACESAHGVLLR